MRGAAVLLLVLVAGCRFDLPGGTPADGAPVLDGPPGDGTVDGPPGTVRRKQITIDPARVTGDLAAFPVWIVLAADADLAARATASGADLHFTGAGGTPLPYQLQRWTQATGHLEAWVKVDLDDDLPTVVELRYGEPGAAHAPDPPAVFSSAFAAVWHLDDPLAAATVAEATGQRAGTAMGGLGPADQIAARLGGGIDFDGNDDQIQFVNPFAGGGSHTFSAWVNQRTATVYDSVVTVGNPATNQSRWFHSHFMEGVSAGFFANDLPGSVANIENDGWVLLHWTWSGATRQSRVYVNGAQVDSRTLAGTVNTQGAAGYLGYAPSAWGPAALNGTLDEVRLSTAERSAGWIATEHANQSAPQTFYTVGPEQLVP
jgi:hypothetical protein